MTPEHRRAAWWWAPTVGAVLLLDYLAVNLALAGQWALAGAAFLGGGVLALQRADVRRAYRSGWRLGFTEAMVGGHEATHHGRIPAFALRAQTRGGDAAPEPWDAVGEVTEVRTGFGRRDDENP